MNNLWYLLMGLVCVACGRGAHQTVIDDQLRVAQIDGEAITKAELSFYMSLEKAKVADHFFKAHGMEVNADFWTTDMAGETPIAALRDSAWRLLQRDYAIKATAIANGIIESAAFETLLTGLTEENRQRENALRENRIVYGPTKFDMRGYYFHYMSTLQTQLKRKGITEWDTRIHTALDTAVFNEVTL